MNICKGMILKHKTIDILVRVGHRVEDSLNRTLYKLEEVTLQTNGWGKTFYTEIFSNNYFYSEEEKINSLYEPMPNSINFIRGL